MKDKLIIYGAGREGKRTLKFMKFLKKEKDILCFYDKNYKQIGSIENIPVLDANKIEDVEALCIVAVSKDNGGEEILHELEIKNVRCCLGIEEWIKTYIADPVERERLIVALYHIETAFYDEYDSEDSLKLFWDKDSVFFKLFKYLDLKNVIELACGHGRHVRKYMDDAEKILLVDILDSNLEVCKDKFKDSTKIQYYCNNGHDLKDLEDNSYTALFTYDAMVHFEMFDIYTYLKDIYRVLKPGAYALFHHSNNTRSYKEDFVTGYENRNFMSKEIFAYMAYKCGFEIVSQEVIGWGGKDNYISDLDCITLLRK